MCVCARVGLVEGAVEEEERLKYCNYMPYTCSADKKSMGSDCRTKNTNKKRGNKIMGKNNHI